MASIAAECTIFGAASYIPIAQLSPTLPSPASQFIEAVVTLTWPYSSASNSITFLLSEPDFRLRKERGQVQVQFSGSCGKVIAEARVSSGDRLVLSLEGVEWVRDDSNTTVPGISIEYRLRFSERLLLQFQREGLDEVQKISVDHPPKEDFATVSNILNPEPENTLVSAESPKNSVTPLFGQDVIGDGLYSSPAFLKRARTSYGSLFDSDLDDYTEVNGSLQGFSRKRTRLSTTWGYDYHSSSSEEDNEENRPEVSTKLVESADSSNPPAMIDEAVQTYSESYDERPESKESIEMSDFNGSDNSNFFSNETSSGDRLVPEDESNLKPNKILAQTSNDLLPKPPEDEYSVSIITNSMTHNNTELVQTKQILKETVTTTSGRYPDIDTHIEGEEINRSNNKNNEDNKLDLQRILSRSDIESTSQAFEISEEQTRTDHATCIHSDTAQTRKIESCKPESTVSNSKQQETEESFVDIIENKSSVSVKSKLSEEPESNRRTTLSNLTVISTDLSDRDESPASDLYDRSSNSGNEIEINSNAEARPPDSYLTTISSDAPLVGNTHKNEGDNMRSRFQENGRALDDDQSIDKGVTEIETIPGELSQAYEDYSSGNEAETEDIEGQEENSSEGYSDFMTQTFAYTDDQEYEDETYYVGQDMSSPAGYENLRDDDERERFSEEEREIDCYESQEQSPAIINLLSSDDEEEEPTIAPSNPSLGPAQKHSINRTEEEKRGEDIYGEDQGTLDEETELTVNISQKGRDFKPSDKTENSEKKQEQSVLQIVATEEDKDAKIQNNSLFSNSTGGQFIAADSDFAQKEISQNDKTSNSRTDNPRITYSKEKLRSKDSSSIEDEQTVGIDSEASSKSSHDNLHYESKSIDIEEENQHFWGHQQNNHVENPPESSLLKAGKIVDDTRRDIKSVKPQTPSTIDPPNTATIKSRLRGHDASIELALSSVSLPSIIDMKLKLTRTLRTELSEFTSLKLLRYHLNEKLDVLAIVTSSPAPPRRVKGGPRDYFLTFNITDPTIAPSNITRVQIFRPCQEALPLVNVGDGILLRNFQVLIEKKLFYLKSKTGEGSSWAVFKSAGEIQIRGPPVELSAVETEYISDLKKWFSELDTAAQDKISRANGKSNDNTK